MILSTVEDARAVLRLAGIAGTIVETPEGQVRLRLVDPSVRTRARAQHYFEPYMIGTLMQVSPGEYQALLDVEPLEALE